MAKVPLPSLPGGGNKIGKAREMYVLRDRIKVYFLYWIVLVLAIEGVSVLVYKQPNYALFWYPILTQSQLFVLILAFVSHGKILNYCDTKLTALWLYAMYYFLGIIAIVLGINATWYDYLTNIILSTVVITFIASFFDKK